MIIPILVLTILPVIAWFLHCNNKAARQRIAMIKSVPNDQWEELYPLWDAVEHKDHARYLFTFRDPYILYDERLRP